EGGGGGGCGVSSHPECSSRGGGAGSLRFSTADRLVPLTPTSHPRRWHPSIDARHPTASTIRRNVVFQTPEAGRAETWLRETPSSSISSQGLLLEAADAVGPNANCNVQASTIPGNPEGRRHP